MQKNKKFLAALLCMAMLSAVLPCISLGAEAVDSGMCADNLTWTLDSEGNLTISGTGEMILESSPWYENSAIKSVIIEEGVTNIGEGAFEGCTGLTSATIPESVTAIGDSAFEGCGSLTNLKIPKNVTTIGARAFYGCGNIMSIKIPEGVTNIAFGTFFNCAGLISITIPTNVTGIEIGAFLGCEKLTYINFMGTEEEWNNIGKGTLNDSLGNVRMYYNYTPDGDDVEGGKCGDNLTWKFDKETGTLTISCEYTDEGAKKGTMDNWELSAITPWYNYNSLITSVVIESGTENIGNGAFGACGNLTSVRIADSVTGIGTSAFEGCGNLTEIAIPGNVESIGDNAFSSCGSLVSVTIPNSVTDIGNGVFEKCTGLASVSLPNGITNIGKDAFRGCSGLTSIVIPDGVSSIGDNAFFECAKLKGVTIPNSVTSVGNSAFLNCYILKDVYYTGSEANWKRIAIGSNNQYLTKAAIHYNYIPANISAKLGLSNGQFAIDFVFGGLDTAATATIVSENGAFGETFAITAENNSIGLTTLNSNVIYYASATANGITTAPTGASLYSVVIDEILNGGYNTEDNKITADNLNRINEILNKGGLYEEGGRLTEETSKIIDRTEADGIVTYTLKDVAVNAGLRLSSDNKFVTEIAVVQELEAYALDAVQLEFVPELIKEVVEDDNNNVDSGSFEEIM